MIPVSTAIACAVANVNRQTFNEVVSSGDYAGAPATTKGKTRLFDGDALLQLFVFGELMRWGLSATQAAGTAGVVARVAGTFPATTSIHLNRHSDGSQSIWPDGKPADHPEPVSSIVLHINAINAFLAERLAKVYAEMNRSV